MKNRTSVMVPAIFVLMLVLFVTALATINSGTYVTKTASGKTEAAVYFASASANPRVVSVSATSDKAGSVVAFQPCTSASTVLVAQAASATTSNFVVGKCSVASNNVILIQNSADAIVEYTLWGNSLSTNKTIPLLNPLGTAVAVSDVFRERQTNYYIVQTDAVADATVIYIDRTNGLAADDILALYRGDGEVVVTNATVASAETNIYYWVNLRTPARAAVTIGDTIYEQVTNYCKVLGTTAADGLSFHVATTNGFTDADVIVVESSKGELKVLTIDTAGASTTNLTTSAAAGFVVKAGDYIRKLHATTRTAIWPVVAGDTRFLASVSTGLVANDVLIIVPTGLPAYRNWVNGTPASMAAYTVTLTAGILAIKPGERLYELSQTAITATFTQTAADTLVRADMATSLAAGDRVVCIPASGAIFQNWVTAAGSDYPLSTLTMTTTNATARVVGETVWLVGATAASLPVGNATISRDSAALYAAPATRPFKVTLDGTSACAINSITVFYAP